METLMRIYEAVAVCVYGDATPWPITRRLLWFHVYVFTYASCS